MTAPLDSRTRWLALIVLCMGDLMIVLDTTIVNVALPSIGEDLGFSETSLAWVVNAYLLTFGGFLLLGGRLGDLFGHRRLFLIGLVLFTAASLACGLAGSQEMLIAARAVQGLGGALVAVVALSLVVGMFTEPRELAKAMGVISFVAAGGGSIGVLLGGVLTDVLDWHWIFLVNIPVGVAVFAFCLRLVPATRGPASDGRMDVAGAVTVTAALMIAVYAIVNGNETGWTSGETLGLLAVAVVALSLFLGIEARSRSPLMALGMFRLRNVATANIVGVLWAAALFAWFFLSALYLQLVLGYSPLQVGLAFLPANLVMAACSVGLSARLVERFGIKLPLTAGLSIAAAGLALFARAPVDGDFVIDVLPAMLLLGFGAGIAFNPLLLAAMSDVEPGDAGLASGLVNTAFMMGGALGLALLASLAASRTGSLADAGDGPLAALAGGYHLAFLVGALFAVAAAVVSALRFRAGAHAPAHGGEEMASAPAMAEAGPSAAALVGSRSRCEHVFVSLREATILHADLDAFFASVEQRDDPRLRSRPVIVGGGVVMAASYEARAFGVRSAMGGARARRLCPQAIVVQPRFSAYVEASRAVFEIFDETSPIVERVSIDEAFLDVRGLQRVAGSPVQIATRLRRTVREQFGLTLTVGIATTKLLAKVVSGVAKPDGLLLVPPERELAFLHPLAVRRLWGVGAVTAGKLQAQGIVTVGDLARAGEPALIALLGRATGRYLHGAAYNLDVRPLRTNRRRGSFGSQRALGLSPTTADQRDTVLVALVDRVTRRMRAGGQAGRTVVLRLRFADFSRATRSRTLPRATASTARVLCTARTLLAAAEPSIERRGLTLLGVTVGGLERGGPVQLELPLDDPGGIALDAALDAVRDRFGPTAITRAALLNAEPALSAWLQPGEAAEDP